MISLAGATSKEVLHYVDPTLNCWASNTAVLDLGVNDLLNNSNANKVDFVSTLKKLALKCRTNDISKAVVSGIIGNCRISDTCVTDLNKKTARICGENLLLCISNLNIPKSCFFADGLHLAENML